MGGGGGGGRKWICEREIENQRTFTIETNKKAKLEYNKGKDLSIASLVPTTVRRQTGPNLQ